jgi:hypothetical protein
VRSGTIDTKSIGGANFPIHNTFVNIVTSKLSIHYITIVARQATFKIYLRLLSHAKQYAIQFNVAQVGIEKIYKEKVINLFLDLDYWVD